MRITSIALLAASAALLAACSSAPVPREQMAVAKSAVERVNANPGIVSSAPVELQAARDKDGKILDPVVGYNLETGVKGEFFDGALEQRFAFIVFHVQIFRIFY